MNQEESIKKYQKILEDAELLYTESEINKVIDDISVAITNKLKKKLHISGAFFYFYNS